jgi:protein TonB
MAPAPAAAEGGILPPPSPPAAQATPPAADPSAIAATPELPPTPAVTAEAAPAPPPQAEAPPAEPAAPMLAALPQPPPPPPSPPVPARPAPQARPPAPPQQPPQQQAAQTRTLWAPPGRRAPGGDEGAPMASGAGRAEGHITQARPASGISNPAPDYPQISRVRGEQGRVILLVQVDPDGSVLTLSVLTSSGFPALDQEAARTVRRWKFEPARQDGTPVFSTVPVGITFRLDGERRR